MKIHSGQSVHSEFEVEILTCHCQGLMNARLLFYVTDVLFAQCNQLCQWSGFNPHLQTYYDIKSKHWGSTKIKYEHVFLFENLFPKPTQTHQGDIRAVETSQTSPPHTNTPKRNIYGVLLSVQMDLYIHGHLHIQFHSLLIRQIMFQR